MRPCESCGRSYEAASPRSKYCGNTCRSRAHRAAGGREHGQSAGDNVRSLRAAPDTAGGDESGGMVASLERKLRDADRLDTWEGQGALVLARRIEAGRDTGSAIASLHRELRVAIAEALKGVGDVESAVTRRRNELAERRAARHARHSRPAQA
jgi:hypothetical protein